MFPGMVVRKERSLLLLISELARSCPMRDYFFAKIYGKGKEEKAGEDKGPAELEGDSRFDTL